MIIANLYIATETVTTETVTTETMTAETVTTETVTTETVTAKTVTTETVSATQEWIIYGRCHRKYMPVAIWLAAPILTVVDSSIIHPIPAHPGQSLEAVWPWVVDPYLHSGSAHPGHRSYLAVAKLTTCM